MSVPLNERWEISSAHSGSCHIKQLTHHYYVSYVSAQLSDMYVQDNLEEMMWCAISLQLTMNNTIGFPQQGWSDCFEACEVPLSINYKALWENYQAFL